MNGDAHTRDAWSVLRHSETPEMNLGGFSLQIPKSCTEVQREEYCGIMKTIISKCHELPGVVSPWLRLKYRDQVVCFNGSCCRVRATEGGQWIRIVGFML